MIKLANRPLYKFLKSHPRFSRLRNMMGITKHEEAMSKFSPEVQELIKEMKTEKKNSPYLIHDAIMRRQGDIDRVEQREEDRIHKLINKLNNSDDYKSMEQKPGQSFKDWMNERDNIIKEHNLIHDKIDNSRNYMDDYTYKHRKINSQDVANSHEAEKAHSHMKIKFNQLNLGAGLLGTAGVGASLLALNKMRKNNGKKKSNS
jgi:hypothetical protein